MKKFEIPYMNIQRLAKEEVLATSACFEAFACKLCYCSLVQCPTGYECSGLTCPTLSDYD